MSQNPYESPRVAEDDRPSPVESLWDWLKRWWYRLVAGLLISYGLYSSCCTCVLAPGMLFSGTFVQPKTAFEPFLAFPYLLLPLTLIGSGILLFFRHKIVLGFAQILLFIDSFLLALKSVMWVYVVVSEIPPEERVFSAAIMFLIEILPSVFVMITAFFTAAKLNAIIRPITED
jgi:hypothetical protein